MGIGSIAAQSIGDMLTTGWDLFLRGGWLLLFVATFYIVYKLYMKAIQDDFVLSNRRIFLHIKIEKENLQSTLAVEQIFATLHAMHLNFTWAEKYLEGMVQLWMTFEIVSLGGKISYIVSTPEKFRHLVETAFYSQYPNAEISEVEDYMANLKHWDHRTSTWDMWGTEYKLTNDWAYPIRTYREFEHPAAEEPIIDPLTPLLEALSKAEAHELMAVQIVIRPIGDKDWIPHSQAIVKELKEEGGHHGGFWSNLFSFGGQKTLFQIIAEGGASHGHDEEQKQPKVMRMTEGERNIVKGIEMKMTKAGWETKMRHLYIAPKDHFDKNKKTLMVGAFRLFSTGTMNNLKPDVGETWTNYHYSAFEKLEKPFVDFEVHERKHLLLKGFVNRSRWIGAQSMILNSEELATLYHFPLATSSTAPVERIDIKKGQPPANLPIAG